MPEISAHTAPVQPAAQPTLVADAPVANEDSFDNQPFEGVLQRRLGDKAEGKPLDEPTASPTGESVAALALAADGKELPPDIAALIAASQPASTGQAAAASPLEATPLDTVGDEVSMALAQAPLPAALAALRTNDLDVLRDARPPAEAKVDVAAKGFVTASAPTVPWPGLNTALTDTATSLPAPLGASVLAEGVSMQDPALTQAVSAKDIAPLLSDTRGVTSSAPGAIALIPTSATTSTTPTAAAVPSTPLPFAQPGWEQGLGNRVMWMVNQQVQTAELRMNPAHLGPLEVRISIRDDQASVSFVSAHGQVREALQAAIPHLREMLGDNGLNLSNVNIAQHSFADARQRSHDPQSHAGGGQGEAGAGEAHTETTQIVGRLGLIDYYA